MRGAARVVRPADLWTAGLVVLALGTGMRVWALQGTWFFFDDFYFIQKAHGRSITLDYLLTPYNGHLMPAAAALTWLNDRVGGLNYILPAWEIALGFAAAGFGMLRLCVTLFGTRWAALVPATLFVFSPILIPATTWWAAAVNQVPMLIAMTFGLDAFVRHLRHPSPRGLITHLSWFVLGLAFGERAVVAFGLSWLIAILYFAKGNAMERGQSLYERYRATVTAHVTLVTAYVVAYLAWAANFDIRQAARLPLFDVARNLIWKAFGPATIGGPLHFQTSKVTQQIAHASSDFVWLSWIALAALVGVAAYARHGSWKAWLLPGSVLALNSILISTSRAIYFGPEIALDYRFQTEAALAFALAVGFAFLPVEGAVGSVRESRPGPHLLTTRAVAVPLALICVLSTITAGRYPLRHLGDKSPRAYLSAVASEARSQPNAMVLNSVVPAWVWAPMAFPTNTYRRFFGPLGIKANYGPPITDAAMVIDDRGRFVPLQLNVVRRMRTFTPDACTPLGAAPVTFTLDGPVFGFGWYLRIGYRATSATPITIDVGDSHHTVTAEAGEHTLLVSTSGSYESLTVSTDSSTDSSGVCVRRTEIGNLP